MSSKENPVSNILELERLDADFKGIQKLINDAKGRANKLLDEAKNKKNQLIDERIKREEEEEMNSSLQNSFVENSVNVVEDVALEPKDDTISNENAKIDESVVSIGEETTPIQEQKKEETTETSLETKENVASEEVKVEEPKMEEPKKEETDIQPQKTQSKKSKSPESDASKKEVKNNQKSNNQAKSVNVPEKLQEVPKEIINKHRAQNVVEPRVFVPPTPEKRTQKNQGNNYGKDNRNQNGNQNNGRNYQKDQNGYGKDKNQSQGQGRNEGFKPQQPAAGTTFVPKANPKDRRNQGKKFDNSGRSYEEKKGNTKRNLIREAQMEGELSDDEVARRFKLRKGNKGSQEQQQVKITSAVIETDPVAIKTLSEKIGHTAAEIVKVLLQNGQFKNVNDSIDFSTAELVAMNFDISLELKLAQTNEDKFDELFNVEDEPQSLVKRAPIVTIMGHVDHGKTSLLDYIRKSSVAKGEAGGITQHIGAYTIRLRGEKITFIDTPGHEAFTTMRARGAMVTDIAIIVVAADDSIMPQTIEAINHAKAANVPIIVAVNKMDKPAANLEKVLNDLTMYDLICEQYGGDTIAVPVSAKTGEGIESLLDNILVLADLYDLKANPKAKAKGTILEARMDNVVGAVATILVQNGTLKIGDTIVAGSSFCKVRSMSDEKNSPVKSAGPSIPVAVLGFDSVPNAGDSIIACEEKLAKSIANERKIKERNIRLSKTSSLEDIMRQMTEGKLKELNLIVKCDVQGSVEALSQELLKQSNDEVKVKVVHSGVGAVNESDVTLASTCGAIIIAFNVRADSNAKSVAQNSQIQIRTYSIIYEAIEDIQNALKGMLAPKFRESIIGRATVRNTFKISGIGTIAGCYVTEGKIERNAQVRLYRNNVVVYTGNIASLKRMKDDVKEVLQGFECGLSIEKFNDIKEGDEIDCFVMEKYN